eukprot:3620621-Amphidinium_carterae.1
MLHVYVFQISDNSFAGALPDGVFAAMPDVSFFEIFHNVFTGMLPESGLGKINSFNFFDNFYIYQNRFAGTLPVRGMRAMRR